MKLCRTRSAAIRTGLTLALASCLFSADRAQAVSITVGYAGSPTSWLTPCIVTSAREGVSDAHT